MLVSDSVRCLYRRFDEARSRKKGIAGQVRMVTPGSGHLRWIRFKV